MLIAEIQTGRTSHLRHGRTQASLFDHLVCATKERERYYKVERLGGLGEGWKTCIASPPGRYGVAGPTPHRSQGVGASLTGPHAEPN
jgi:hypothetical protein